MGAGWWLVTPPPSATGEDGGTLARIMPRRGRIAARSRCGEMRHVPSRTRARCASGLAVWSRDQGRRPDPRRPPARRPGRCRRTGRRATPGPLPGASSRRRRCRPCRTSPRRGRTSGATVAARDVHDEVDATLRRLDGRQAHGDLEAGVRVVDLVELDRVEVHAGHDLGERLAVLERRLGPAVTRPAIVPTVRFEASE